MTRDPSSRRRFLTHALLATAALPLLGKSSAAWAAPLPKLPLANPQAKSLHYTEDAAKSDQPSHKPGSACANCQFFTAGSNACALFVGFQVAPAGWCTAWAKKA
jgi:hypothetical protein